MWLAVAGLALLGLLAGALHWLWRRNAVLRAQLEAATSDLEHLQRTCSRLAPAGVVQRLAADGTDIDAAPAAERKVVTALFVDLVGYTDLSERLEPAILVRILNGYYQRMTDAIHEHGGQVGSFLGDGVVAYFGAVQPNPWQCGDAVRAALAMLVSIREYNDELVREGLPRLEIGIGIDRGPGVAGLIGARDRMEYAFLGRPVNLAARVQALTRLHREDILVTDAVRSELDGAVELVAMPAEPVVTYAVRRSPQVLHEQRPRPGAEPLRRVLR